MQKEKEKITKIWISQEKKAFTINKKVFHSFWSTIIGEKINKVNRSFNEAYSLPKMFGGLLIEKLIFQKVKWTISLKVLDLDYGFKQVWEIQTYIALINVNNSNLFQISKLIHVKTINDKSFNKWERFPKHSGSQEPFESVVARNIINAKLIV